LYPQNHWDTYRQNFTEKFSPLIDGEITGIVTMNRARGCSRTKDDIKCGHCDMLLDIAFSSPEVFWAEVRNAHEKTGANVFYEACDSFSSFPSLIRGIVAAKPTDLGFTPHFFVYCQAVDIVKNPDLARQLKEMGVFRANVGLESGCDVTLKSMKGVHDSVETNYKALQLLREHNLHVYGSFVLGTALETPETLNETVQWVKKIISEGLIDDVEAQPILPLPHNVYGKKLIADAGVGGNPFRGTEHTDWPFNTDVIATHYINNYSGVSYEQVIAAATTIRQTAQRAGVQFGSGVSHSDLYSPADVVDLVPADREGKANSHLAHIRPPQAGATFDIS